MLCNMRFQLMTFSALLFTAIFLASCAPLASPPTLDEVRLGQGKGTLAADTTIEPGEIRGEVTQVDPSRHEIVVQTDDGRRQVLPYDFHATRVLYHGREYVIDNLEAGDIIAFRYPPRATYVETIRIEEPVQARANRTVGRTTALAPRSEVIEGTVERVHPNLAAFDIRSNSGRMVTVSIPYTARTSDVNDFRRLRPGDYVRVQGEFVNPENLQLLAFLSPR